jgi:Amt family ammonium transporter
LWFGWFGFNAGSALGANAAAVQALLNTFVAAAAGMLGWMVVERLRDGHVTTLGAASGIVAALVAITPAAGYVNTLPSILFGLVASVACYYGIQLKHRLGYDDALDVVGVHGIGGLVGGVMLGLFADGGIADHGQDGLFYGDGAFLGSQLLAMASVIVFSFVVTFAIAKALDATIGLRVDADAELSGLDQAEHVETAYSLEVR